MRDTGATSLTMSIPEAGELLGLSRDASYRAAREGFMHTIQVSPRRMVVPTTWVANQLGVPVDGLRRLDAGGARDS